MTPNSVNFYQLNCDGRIVVESNMPSKKDTIILLQEPYLVRGRPGALRVHNFVSTPEGRTAIYTPNLDSASFLKMPSLIRDDLVAGLLEWDDKKIIVASLYLPSKDKDNKDIKDPVDKNLTDLLDYCKEYNFGLICGADCNAWSRMWFSDKKNYKGNELQWLRGNRLENFFLNNDITVQNSYPCPTYVSRGKRRKTTSSTIDITFTWNFDIPILDWHVDSACLLSDHKPITYNFVCPKTDTKMVRNYFKADWARYKKIIESEMPPIKDGKWSQKRIEDETEILYKYHYRALDIACPERPRKNKKAAEWWNEDCEKAKNAFKTMQRKVFRHNRNKPTDEQWEQIKAARREWARTIRKARREAWRDFVSEINSVPEMAKLSKIVSATHCDAIGLVRKSDGTMSASSEESLGALMEEHFPRCEVNTKLIKQASDNEEDMRYNPWINMKVVKAAIKEFGPHKAPGLDGIKPIVMQNMPDSALERLCRIYTACIQLSYTPHSWRKSRVIFMPKPGKPDKANPRAFRPLSMNSYLLKAMEKTVKFHLEDTIFPEHPLHWKQFAFQKDKGTDNALSNTVDSIEQGLLNHQFVIVVFLDIKGAFDNIKPTAILKAMEDCNIPRNIRNWYFNLLTNRNCECTIGNHTVEAVLKTGMTQGSVLSPPLGWNPPMNKLIVTIDAEPVNQSGFADDEAIVSKDDDPYEAYLKAQRAVDKAIQWANEHGLEFSAAKTQILLLTKNRKFEMPPRIKIYGEEVPYTNEAKYLGITIDNKLTWHRHITEKISKVKRTLMHAKSALAHRWGPKPRYMMWLWTAVLRPRITYGSFVWAKAAERSNIKAKLRSLQGHAMRMISPVRQRTPVRSMELIYMLEPLHLHIKYLALTTVIRINAEVRWQTDLKTKGHIEYARNNLPGILINTMIDRENFSRNWNLDLKLNIGTGKLDDWRPGTNDWSAFTDGSLLDGESGSGVAIYDTNGELTTLGEKPSQATVFQAEIWALNLAASWFLDQDVRGKDIGFYVDSQAALKSVTSIHCDKITVSRARKTLSALSFHNSVTLTWIKSHRQDADLASSANEVADWAARQATLIEQNRSINIPMAMANAKRIIKSMIWKEWELEWQTYPKGRQTKYFINAPSTKFKKITNYGRDTIGRLIQYLTGHSFLRRHNNVVFFGSTDNIGNSNCRLCNMNVDETPHHIITSCPDLSNRRNAYFHTRKLNDFEYKWNLKQMTGFLEMDTLTELEILQDDEDPIENL